MKLEGLSILGQARAKAAGNPFAAINPATGAAIGPDYCPAAIQDINTAAELAWKAFLEFRLWPAKKRQELLNRIAQLLESNASAITERANLETALPAGRLQSELARTCFQLRFYGEAAANGLCAGARIDHGDLNRKPQPKPDLRSMMVPRGPVAVFSATNFPLAYSVAGGDTASALAAGCAVIVKANPGHPGTSEIVGLLIQQAARECGAPEGVFSLLFDSGYEIGLALVKHPLIKAVGFTGSRTGGRALMDAAAARPEPVPVYAEMGSVNPVFILSSAMGDRAEDIAAGLHASVTMGVGQFCTNPGLVFIQSSQAPNNFLAKLTSLMSATAPGTMLTSKLCSGYQGGLEKFSKIPGVKRLVSPASGPGAGKAQVGAALFATGIETFLANHNLMDEVFGPSTLIVECPSYAKMLEAAGRLEGQLTATVHANPDELAGSRELIDLLSIKAGRLIYNGFPTGVEVAHAMTHGGPYPAGSDGSTSVGTRALERFLRPVTYQNFPDAALPPELQEANPLRLARMCDGLLR